MRQSCERRADAPDLEEVTHANAMRRILRSWLAVGFRRHKGRGLFDCGSLSRTRLDIRAGVRPPSICSLNRIQLPIVRRNYAHRRLARLGSCTSWSPTGRRMWGCYQADRLLSELAVFVSGKRRLSCDSETG